MSEREDGRYRSASTTARSRRSKSTSRLQFRNKFISHINSANQIQVCLFKLNLFLIYFYIFLLKNSTFYRTYLFDKFFYYHFLFYLPKYQLTCHFLYNSSSMQLKVIESFYHFSCQPFLLDKLKLSLTTLVN